jgi:hypothetical protein
MKKSNSMYPGLWRDQYPSTGGVLIWWRFCRMLEQKNYNEEIMRQKWFLKLLASQIFLSIRLRFDDHGLILTAELCGLELVPIVTYSFFCERKDPRLEFWHVTYLDSDVCIPMFVNSPKQVHWGMCVWKDQVNGGIFQGYHTVSFYIYIDD